MNEQKEIIDNLSHKGGVSDFVSLAKGLWQRRVFIVSGFILLTVIGALIVFLAPKKFRGEAFFQVGSLAKVKTGMSIPVFKQGEMLLHDLDHMQAFMASDQSIGKNERERFLKINKNNKKLKKYFVPVANFTKIDQLSQDEGSSVIGFQLTYMGETPEITKKFVEFFANYIRGSYLAIALDEHILLNYDSHSRSVKECENKDINYRERLESLKKQKEKWEALARRFPMFSNADEQMVKKLANPSAHYMSPNLRLNAVESQLLGIHMAMEDNAQKKEISIGSLKFFSRARHLLEKKRDHGTVLLARLQALKKDIFSGKNPESPAVLFVENTLSIDLQRFQDIYYGVFKFISGPNVLLENTLSARIFQAMLISLFSLIFMISATLLLHWGNRNWKRIVG